METMTSSILFKNFNIKIIILQQMMVHLPTPQVSPHKMFKEVRNNGNPKRGGIPKIFLNS
jgi:hypothetical protein